MSWRLQCVYVMVWYGTECNVVVCTYWYMGVSKNRGKPPKWMVKIMENPIKIDDLGVPLFLETPIYIYIFFLHTYIHTYIHTFS